MSKNVDLRYCMRLKKLLYDELTQLINSKSIFAEGSVNRTSVASITTTVSVNSKLWPFLFSFFNWFLRSMALDPFQNWIALGTSLGYHVIWDKRFQLPICYRQHEGHKNIHILKFLLVCKFMLFHFIFSSFVFEIKSLL